MAICIQARKYRHFEFYYLTISYLGVAWVVCVHPNPSQYNCVGAKYVRSIEVVSLVPLLGYRWTCDLEILTCNLCLSSEDLSLSSLVDFGMNPPGSNSLRPPLSWKDVRGAIWLDWASRSVINPWIPWKLDTNVERRILSARATANYPFVKTQDWATMTKKRLCPEVFSGLTSALFESSNFGGLRAIGIKG